MTPDDSTLLQRFAHRRDEMAFTLLVERHGPLVTGACLRVLGRRADAEDATQAVFLILAREVGRLDHSRPLAPWLHRVAVNAARDLERERRARLQREQKVMTMANITTSEDVDPALAETLDLCLAELPERERQALVLVYLQGMSPQECAQRLGRSEGTVGSWLHRGRERLRTILHRRSIKVPVAALLLALGELRATDLPSRFASATGSAAAAFADSMTTKASACALTLAEKGLRSMRLLRLQKGGILAASLLVVTSFAGWIVLNATDSHPTPPLANPPLTEPANATKTPALTPESTAIQAARILLSSIAAKESEKYLKLLSKGALAEMQQPHPADIARVAEDLPGLLGEHAWLWANRPEWARKPFLGNPVAHDSDMLVVLFNPDKPRPGNSSTVWTRFLIMRKESEAWMAVYMEDDWLPIADINSEKKEH
jgi:RNA polymerase sigma factor (sigma-70 family)